MTDPSVPGEVEKLIETVDNAAEGAGDISIHDVVGAFGRDALASLMLAPALIMVSPASGIPGLSTACALIVALAAFQLSIGRHTLWLPGILGRRRIARSKLDKAAAWLRKPARLLDRVTGKRLAVLARPPVSIVASLLCALMALCVPFLELVPFSASLAGAAIAFIALGLVARDGVVILIGLIATGGAAALIWTLAT